MRKYTVIWRKIRDSEDHKCSIAAPEKLHLRIIKAVINEKWRDLGYKFALGEQHKTAKLYYKRDGAKVDFWVVIFGTDVTDL